MRFCLQPEVLRSSAPAILPHEMPPREMPPHEMLLAQMFWSQSKMLDLGPIDALNFFVSSSILAAGSPVRGALQPTPRPCPTPPRSVAWWFLIPGSPVSRPWAPG